MKKLFLIVVMLFAVATTQAQTASPDVIDTLETNSRYARGKVVLPETIAKDMIIERATINDQNVIIAQFNRRLNEKEIELVKTYMGFYYEKKLPKGKKYNTSAPDIRNTKKRCIITFYKY